MHPRTAPAAYAAVALAYALTGCSGGTAADAPRHSTAVHPTSAPATTATPTTPALSADLPACTSPTDPVPTTGPVADQFGGAAKLTAAYRFASSLLTRTTFTATPLADPQPPQNAFAAAEAGLTPRARDSFRVLTAKLASTTENLTPQEDADLTSLASYGVTVAYPGLTLRDPAYRDVTCGKATVEALARPGLPDALVLRFLVSGAFLLADPAGRPQAVAFNKQMDLSLEATGDPRRPWLVDGWRGDRTVGAPGPDPTS